MVSTPKYDVATRGITFAPQALGVPRGGGFSSKNAKQQGAAFFVAAGREKQASLFFPARRHKMLRLAALRFWI